MTHFTQPNNLSESQPIQGEALPTGTPVQPTCCATSWSTPRHVPAAVDQVRRLGRPPSATVVVGVNPRGLMPDRRWRLIDPATVMQDTVSLSSRRSARILGDPCT